MFSRLTSSLGLISIGRVTLLALAFIATITPVVALSTPDSFIRVRRTSSGDEVEEWPRAEVEFGRRYMAQIQREVEEVQRLGKRQSSPAVDKFYIPPSGFASKAPGTILRTRSVSLSGIPSASNGGIDFKSWQILYRTVPENNTVAMATVTTLLVPKGATLDRLIAYSLPTDAASPICRPSYISQYSSAWTEPLLSAFLNQAYAVTTSDYEGSDDAFGAAHLAGHAVLDSVRATLAFTMNGTSSTAFSGFKSTTKVALAGYSGGAVATGWAAALQPTYAAKVPIVGAVFGGTPSNLSTVLEVQDGTYFAGFGFIGVRGLTRAFSGLANVLAKQLTPTGTQALANVAKGCTMEVLQAFANERFLGSTKYQKLGPKLIQDATVKSIMNTVTLGYNKTETPKIPLFVVHAVDDTIIPVSLGDTMVNRFCKNNATSVIYQRAQNAGGHVGLAIEFVGNATAFVADRFAGKTAVKGCKISTVSYS